MNILKQQPVDINKAIKSGGLKYDKVSKPYESPQRKKYEKALMKMKTKGISSDGVGVGY